MTSDHWILVSFSMLAAGIMLFVAALFLDRSDAASPPAYERTEAMPLY